jgi:SAM-dependent methyltransferase
MQSPRSFAGGDQHYLRTVQYTDSTKLAARAELHVRFSTAPVTWFPWVAGLVDWPAGAAVLDAGCGPAYLWAGIAGLVPDDVRLTLADLSPGMVAGAETRARAAGIDVVEAQVADHQDLPFATDRFDVVIANHTLYHSPEPERSVTELARVLAPDGVLVAATNGPDHLRQLNDLWAEVFGEQSRDVTADVFGRLTGAPMLDRHLGAVTWHAYPDELACTDPGAVLAYLRSAPPGETADADELSRLRSALDTRFEAGGGTFRITKDVGAFVARHPRGPG